jgi:hypothetical protein
MAIRYLSGIDVDQNTLFVDDVNNRVGIGTASPSEKFSVYGGDAIFTQFTGAGNGSFLKILNSTTTTNGTTLQASYFGSGGFGDLKFEVGGSERLRITSAGNVGIGTTSPAHRLTINAPNNTIAVGIDFPSAHFDFSANSTSGYNSRFHMDNVGMDIGHDSTARSLNLITADVDRVTILGNGNVGIGTTSPSAKLEVVGATGVITIRTTYPTDLSQRGALLWKDATNITGAIDTRYDGTTVDMYFGSLYSSGYNSTTRMVIKGNGNVGIGTTAPGYKLEVEDTIGIKRAGVAATSTIQQTGAGLTVNAPSGYHPLIVQYAGTEFARINNSGNVGIGTTAPSSLLHVSGTNTSILSSIVENTSSASGAYAGYLIKSDYAHSYLPGLLLNSSTNTAYAGADQLMLYQFHSKPISLVTNNIVRLMVSGAGNVGIGTTSPATALQVNGTARATRLNSTGGVVDFDAETGNNFIQIASNIVSIANGGNVSMTITATGNVGIGTTSPSSKLQVDGTITVTNGGINIPADSPIRRDGDNSIIGYSSALPGINIGSGTATDMVVFNAGGVERIRVNTLGNVGIGTAAPSYRLHVVGTIGNNGGGVQFPREFRNDFTPNAERADIFFFSNFTSNNALRIGTLASSGGTTLQSTRANDSSLKTSLLLNPDGGNVGIGTTAPGYKLTVNGDVDVNNGAILAAQPYGINLGVSGYDIVMPATTRIAIKTEASERISILNTGNVGIGTTSPIASGGNVGIGTTSPGEKLEIIGGGASDAVEIRLGTNTSSYRVTSIGQNDGNGTFEFGSYLDTYIVNRWTTNDNGDLILGTNNQEQMRISHSGNVGIGTASPSQKLHVSGNVRVTGAYYDSSNSAGSSGQVLSSTGSGTAWVNQGEATATSLFDLLPAARVSYNWVGQVVNDTWTTVFSKSSNLLTTGTWMVKMYVSDFATGGGHYTYTYSGMFTWYQDTTNQGGEQAASEIYLHRMGHAANASVLYLRTTETTAASSGDGFFQIKGNYSNTANQTIQFQFVKIF